MSWVQRLAQKHHNSSLVKPEESPNANTQVLIFPDGGIYTTKGGWAFLRRSFFEWLGPVPGYKPRLPFPRAYGDSQSFAMVKDLKTAELIREAMVIDKTASLMVPRIIREAMVIDKTASLMAPMILGSDKSNPQKLEV